MKFIEFLGGREAMSYEFPHQALLGYDNNNNIEWKCGGSLVSRNYILTGMQTLIFKIKFTTSSYCSCTLRRELRTRTCKGC
jgi:hypothetical protein